MLYSVFKGIMLRQLLKIQRSQVDILDQLTRSGANFQNSNPIDYSTPPTFPLDSIVEIRGFEVFLQTETDFDLAVSVFSNIFITLKTTILCI